MTCCREEIKKEEGILLEILRTLETLDVLIVYHVHLQNRERAIQLQKCMDFSMFF